MFIVKSSSNSIEKASRAFYKMTCSCGCTFVVGDHEFENSNNATGVLEFVVKCPECNNRLTKQHDGVEISEEEKTSLWAKACTVLD